MAIEEKKKVSVSIDPEVRSPQIYHQFLITSTENALHIDLADSVETNDEIKIEVKESFSVSADKMLNFAASILNELIRYEEKYHNGYGLSYPDFGK